MLTIKETVLQALKYFDTPKTTTVLANYLELSRKSVSDALGRLRKQGLCDKTEDNKWFPITKEEEALDIAILINKVIGWADKRKLLNKANAFAQSNKVLEEALETQRAIIHNDMDEIKDGIGDTLVTLIILSQQYDLSLEECLQAAYDVIKNRTGTTKNGQFIKD